MKMRLKRYDKKFWLSNWVFDKRFTYKCLYVQFQMRDSKGYMGRFGGGWNWKLGFQSGGTTIIFSLLVCEIVISWRKTK